MRTSLRTASEATEGAMGVDELAVGLAATCTGGPRTNPSSVDPDATVFSSSSTRVRCFFPPAWHFRAVSSMFEISNGDLQGLHLANATLVAR